MTGIDQGAILSVVLGNNEPMSGPSQAVISAKNSGSAQFLIEQQRENSIHLHTSHCDALQHGVLFCVSAVLLVAEERIQKHSDVVHFSQAVLKEFEHCSLVVRLDQTWADKVHQAALNLRSTCAQMMGMDLHNQSKHGFHARSKDAVAKACLIIMSKEQSCRSGHASCGIAGIPGTP